MKKYLHIVLVMVGSISMGQDNTIETAGTLTVQVNPMANPNAPEISFVETIHDFGTVKEGSPVTYRFAFTNTGKQPLIIRDCFAGCHCTTARFSKDPVLPGGKGFIEVHYDSTMVGVIMKELLVSSNARKPVEFLLIKGIVKDADGKEKGLTEDEEIIKSKSKKVE